MKKALNRPLKRLAFVLFVTSCTLFVALIMLPAPISFSAKPYLERITRLDTRCASGLSGGVEAFAKDFSILDGTIIFADPNIEHGKKFTIADKVDLTNEDRASFLLRLSGGMKPCYENVCIETLTRSSFESILASCGVFVDQLQYDQNSVTWRWRLADNFEDHDTWAIAALVSSVVFLLMSLLYNKTLGRIVKWIRNG